jgi:hypothetical protein
VDGSAAERDLLKKLIHSPWPAPTTYRYNIYLLPEGKSRSKINLSLTSSTAYRGFTAADCST